MEHLIASMFGTLLALYVWETFKKSKIWGIVATAATMLGVGLAGLVIKRLGL